MWSPGLGKALRISGLLAAIGCASSQPWKPPTDLDTRDDPAVVRAGFGNAADLHLWWPLTSAEIAAVKGLEQARQGDARALLALAVFASADQRDEAAYAGHQQRVAQFVADIKPTIDGAGDDWHRGYELNRAMHRVFFAPARGELGSYSFDQARITGIFAGGRYNCLSSALLYTVLARAFDLPVRAAIVPTHVFVEMGPPEGKIIEIETTSATGFDWVHDERFYKESAAQWSSSRGLRPVTLDEYKQRKIAAPHVLIATAMQDSRAPTNDADRWRLHEVAAELDPDDVELQRIRMQLYTNEAFQLFEKHAWRTMVKMFDAVRPAIAAIAAKTKDPKTLELVSWASWDYAEALMVVGRADEATQVMSEALDRLDTSWPDFSKLRGNYLSVLNNRIGDLVSKKDYPAAVKIYARHRDFCRSNEVCAGNVGVVYGNWSIDHRNAGDWQAARQVLRDCVNELPNDVRCREALADLESRHRF